MSLSQIKKGAMLGYADIFITNAVGIFLTPFIVHSLGNSEYGLYSLIGSFVAYISLMDMGLNNTIIRFVSKFRAQNDIIGERKFLGTTLLIYLAISLIVIIIGVAMYFNTDTIFQHSLSAEEISKAKIMVAILIFNIAVVLPSGTFTAICIGYEHFVYPKLIRIVRVLLRSATVVAILSQGGDAISLVVIDTLFNLLFALVSYIYTKKKLKIKYDFTQFNFSAIKPIVSYSIWIFIIAITQYMQWQCGSFVVGIATDTTQVAIYSIGIVLGSYFGAFSSVVNSMLLPKASKMVQEGATSTSLTDVMIKVAKYNNLVSFFILGGFVLLGRDFIFLWLGVDYETAWQLALFIMIVSLIPLSQSMGMSILEAKNKIRFRAIFNLVTLFIGVIIGYILTKKYGIVGMNYAICSAMLINSIAITFYFKKTFGFRIFRFFNKSLSPMLLSSAALVTVLFLLKQYFIFENTWLNFFISGCVYFILYALFAYILYLRRGLK